MPAVVKPRNPVFCAFDTALLDQAKSWAKSLAQSIGGIKLGLEFFSAQGPAGVAEVVGQSGLPLFLDLKFHDIPNTVAGAIKSVAPLRPFMVNVHASGSATMMRAAADAAGEAAAKLGSPRPLVLGVTILTSLDDGDLAAVGMQTSTADQVRRLAALAKSSGLDGVVCSPHEAALLRRDLGPGFVLVTPGVRPTWAGAQDQKRVMTPAEVLATGADYVVVGRPITGAADQAAAAQRIVTELAA
ncbi:MAG: orotidine-5'-phosphate decarboxylase [Alphaproteobacteria bacterium]|nr:orotidine-5'-phosphate decarboxylase [Alphaproteobacteria bacterium]